MPTTRSLGRRDVWAVSPCRRGGRVNNNPPNVAANDASVNASSNGLDSSIPGLMGDGGIRDQLGDANISDFFSDGGLNEGAICATFPQACVDGSVVRPNRDGGTPRGDGGMFQRDGGRPMPDGSAAEDDAGGDAGGDAGQGEGGA